MPAALDARARRRLRAPSHSSRLTSRNSPVGDARAPRPPEPGPVGSAEGGSNVTLVRGTAIAERRELELTEPSRSGARWRFARLASGVCVANLHATNAAPKKAAAEVLAAAERERSSGPATRPLVFGGDLNLRPDRAPEAFEALADDHGLARVTAGDAIDHLLARGLEAAEPPERWPAERREVVEDGLGSASPTTPR